MLGHAASASITKKSPAKKNLVIFVTGLGFHPHSFTPKKGTLDSDLMSRLKEHHNDLTVLRNIGQNELSRGHGGQRGVITCNRNQRNGPFISLDQFIAENITRTTPFKYINIGERGLSWNKDSRAVQALSHLTPEEIFKELFTNQQLPSDVKKKLGILKSIRTQATRGKKNQSEYRKILETLEDELETEIKWSSMKAPKVDFDTGLALADRHGRGAISPILQRFNFATASFLHKRTNVMLISPSYIDKYLPLKVESGSYHAVGHMAKAHKNGKVYDDMLKIEGHIFDCFSQFLTSLKKENLLNDTIVLFKGGFGNPGSHSRQTLPTILAGGGFNHQGVIECKNEREENIHPLAHLYVTIMHQMGLDIDEFSSYRGNLDRMLIK